MQIICIDNGSTDDSADIIARWSQQFRQICYAFKPGGRQGRARNEGLAMAKGEYVGFLDSDDFVSPDFFATLLAKARQAKADFSIGNMLIFDECTQHKSSIWITKIVSRYPANSVITRQDEKLHLLHANHCCNKVYRRSFLTSHKIFFPENLVFEDNLFNLMTTFFAKRIAICAETFYYYVKRSSNSSTTDVAPVSSQSFDIFEVGKRMRDFLITQRSFSADSPWKTEYLRYIIVNHYLSYLWRQAPKDRIPFITRISTALNDYADSEILRFCPPRIANILLTIKHYNGNFTAYLYLFYRPREIARRVFHRLKQVRSFLHRLH